MQIASGAIYTRPYASPTETHTHIYPTQCRFLPSLVPPIHILIDTKHVYEYDLIALAAWSAKRNNLYEQYWKENSIVNDVQLTAHLICSKNIPKTFTILQCNLSKSNIVFPCYDCLNYLTMVPIHLQLYSVEIISVFQNSKDSNVSPASFLSNAYSKDKLAPKIVYFMEEEQEAIRLPFKNIWKLQHKYSNPIQILGMAYASVFTIFMGNVTAFQDTPAITFEYGSFWNFLIKNARIDEYKDTDNNNALKTDNKFGSLRFVSCGSRGIEAFPFRQWRFL